MRTPRGARLPLRIAPTHLATGPTSSGAAHESATDAGLGTGVRYVDYYLNVRMGWDLT